MTRHDKETGEVLDEAPTMPQERPLTPRGHPGTSGARKRAGGAVASRGEGETSPLGQPSDEEAERRREWKSAKQVAKAHELSVLEAIDPAVRLDSDPPVDFSGASRPMAWDARTSSGELLVEAAPRVNGSTVRVVRRVFVGEAGTSRYVGVYVLFRGTGGVQRRSRGVALISRAEVQAARDALDRELADWAEEAT